MRNLLAGMLFVLCLAGCDPARVAKLEEGVSTEAQVRQEFGEPITVTVLPDGSKVLDYPRQPEGWTNYRIAIGADGKMSALRQLLHADNFAKVKPGLDDNAVRELLGKPARVQPWQLQGEVSGRGASAPMPTARRSSACTSIAAAECCAARSRTIRARRPRPAPDRPWRADP